MITIIIIKLIDVITITINIRISVTSNKKGAEGISKFAVNLCSPMQETRTVYLAPKCLQK